MHIFQKNQEEQVDSSYKCYQPKLVVSQGSLYVLMIPDSDGYIQVLRYDPSKSSYVEEGMKIDACPSVLDFDTTDNVLYVAYVINDKIVIKKKETETGWTGAKLYGASLSLGGDIALNFYTELSSDVISDTNSYMRFDINGKEKSRMLLSNAKKKVINNTTYYAFSCGFYATQMEDIVNAKMYRSNGEEILSVEYSVNKCAQAFKSTGDNKLIALNGSYLLAFLWSAASILNKTMSYGTLIAIIQLVNQITQPFTNLSGLIPKYYSMIASAERLMEIENIQEETKEMYISREDCDSLYKDMKSIDCDRVSFSYEDKEKRNIKDVSFNIKKGDFFTLKGESGIGKSTMLKLLLSVYEPSSGRICFNTENGLIDLKPMYRSMFAYVPQGNFLLSGTIAQAVCFFDSEEPDLDKVKEVCHIACADRFIEKLPQGYNTKLGEKGSGLSEGQIQRIAIARALYTQAPILLLDESTSALDADTERQLLCNLKELTDKTVVIVTHRMIPEEIHPVEFRFKGVVEDNDNI